MMTAPLLQQCPGCWSTGRGAADIECECGERMAVVDLRAALASPEPAPEEPCCSQENPHRVLPTITDRTRIARHWFDEAAVFPATKMYAAPDIEAKAADVGRVRTRRGVHAVGDRDPGVAAFPEPAPPKDRQTTATLGDYERTEPATPRTCAHASNDVVRLYRQEPDGGWTTETVGFACSVCGEQFFPGCTTAALATAIARANYRTRERTRDGEPMLDDGFEWYASPREMAAEIAAQLGDYERTEEPARLDEPSDGTIDRYRLIQEVRKAARGIDHSLADEPDYERFDAAIVALEAAAIARAYGEAE